MFLPLIQIWNNQFSYQSKIVYYSTNSPKGSNNIISFPVNVTKNYNNLHLISTQNQIKNELKDLMGIYAFLHIDSGNMYIGSSAFLSNRFSDHIFNRSSNVYLQRSFNKYGLDNFTFYILEFYTFNFNLSKIENGELLIQLEQQYFNLLSPRYNINPTAGSRLGSKHSKGSKEKMRINNIGSKNPFFGKTHSDDFLAKLKIRMSGNNNPMAGNPISEHVKNTIRATQNKPVYLYNFYSKELLKVFPNQAQVYLEFKASPKTIIKYLKSGQIYKNKYLLSSILLSSSSGGD